jgi:hypothetical protein
MWIPGTGQVCRGRIDPACRATLRSWLERFAGRDDVTFAVEGCTGWRFVVAELERAGITPLLAEPAGTAHLRGPGKHAKTDKADRDGRPRETGAATQPAGPPHRSSCRRDPSCLADRGKAGRPLRPHTPIRRAIAGEAMT